MLSLQSLPQSVLYPFKVFIKQACEYFRDGILPAVVAGHPMQYETPLTATAKMLTVPTSLIVDISSHESWFGAYVFKHAFAIDKELPDIVRINAGLLLLQLKAEILSAMRRTNLIGELTTPVNILSPIDVANGNNKPRPKKRKESASKQPAVSTKKANAAAAIQPSNTSSTKKFKATAAITPTNDMVVSSTASATPKKSKSTMDPTLMTVQDCTKMLKKKNLADLPMLSIMTTLNHVQMTLSILNETMIEYVISSLVGNHSNADVREKAASLFHKWTFNTIDDCKLQDLDSQVALRILTRLENVTMTRSILSDTKIGKRVGRLARKHHDSDVKARSSTLIVKWMAIANAKTD